MKAGLERYDLQKKDHWRREVWNELAKRIKAIKPLRDATVVYLPGPHDVDRVLALKRGFRNHNLIAVDFSESNIAAVRKGGGIGVCLKLDAFLHGWSDGPIDAFHYDLCGGADVASWTVAMATLQCSGLTPDSHLMFNVQNGRERCFKHPVIGEDLKRLLNNTTIQGHRGTFMYGMFFNAAGEMLKTPAARQQLRQLAVCSDLHTRPTIRRYRSTGSLYFHSVIFRSPCGQLQRVDTSGIRQHPDIAKMHRKIAALKAIRTMAERSGPPEHLLSAVAAS